MSEFGKDINVPSRKGVFIPDITVEMFRNASLESVEDLMASGEMEDISLPSAQPEQRWNRLMRYLADLQLTYSSEWGANVQGDEKIYEFVTGLIDELQGWEEEAT